MSKLKCFVIMPYRNDFDAVFKTVGEAATQALVGDQLECHWLKGVYAAGRITDDIIESLQKATLCVSDLTGGSPNVMWETGYAMALGKPTILIGQSIEKLPFDLKVHRVIEYSPDALAQLTPKLVEGIRQTLSKHEIKAKMHPIRAEDVAAPCIVVTGSMDAEPARVARRVESLLSPYLGRGTTWYCGTAGNVDEAVLMFLMAHKERVVAVAYHCYDFSPNVRRLVESGKLSFIDASLEAIPKGLAGPSEPRFSLGRRTSSKRIVPGGMAGLTERDSFFCAKGDLIILFWDGKSRGTQQLIRYFTENGKNLLAARV